MSTVTIPTVDEEIWRYSRIGELDLESFRPGQVTTTIDGPADSIKKVVSRATSVVPRTSSDLFEDLNAKNAALTAICVAKGQTITQPIIITHSLNESGVVAYPRLVIDAQENSEITIVERFISGDDIASLVVPVVDVRAAQSARVTYVAINELGAATWQIGYQQAVGQRDSMMKLFSVALGGDYAPKFASRAKAPTRNKSRSILLAQHRCTTFARCKITPRRARAAICCSKVRSKTLQKVFIRV
jgi:Fe-S cluster assembly protein SufD